MTRFGSRRPRRRLVTTLVGVGFLSLAFASSGGSTTPASAHVRPAASGHHCIVQISPVLPGQTSSRMSAPRCFATFRQAISAATSGAVRKSATSSSRLVGKYPPEAGAGVDPGPKKTNQPLTHKHGTPTVGLRPPPPHEMGRTGM